MLQTKYKALVLLIEQQQRGPRQVETTELKLFSGLGRDG
jgi:hypothetical protein